MKPLFPQVPGGQKLNQDDVNQRNIAREQNKKDADTYDLMQAKGQASLTNIKRINAVLDRNPNLGPGSNEATQIQTFMANWFGTEDGQAAARQVLSKFLNADQMNNILTQFHGEGAQVRLGAYESRLIIEQLAANPQMTRTAIKQMLNWQAADSTYDVNMARTAAHAIDQDKNMATFANRYQSAFPKAQAVDTSLSAFHKAAPNGAVQEVQAYMKAGTHPELIKSFQDHFGYLPAQPSAPTAQEVGTPTKAP